MSESDSARIERLEAELAQLRAESRATQDERDRAIARMEFGFLRGLETVGGRAEILGNNAVVLGNPVGSLARMETMRSLTAADLQDVARRYLLDRPRTVVLVRSNLATGGA